MRLHKPGPLEGKKPREAQTTQQNIESTLLAGGNGTRAVMYGTDGVTGHVWNAVVQNGKVNYIDGQIGGGGAVNCQNFTHFQFGKLP
nr:toxin glutamine deamidase domain-containing protein [Burkholderia multivorans]